MKDNVVALMRAGLCGERTVSEAWEFETYPAAEDRLRALYTEEIRLLKSPMQSSFFDAETGQFKILGDNIMVIGSILTINRNTNVKADYLGVNLGPNPEA